MPVMLVPSVLKLWLNYTVSEIPPALHAIVLVLALIISSKSIATDSQPGSPLRPYFTSDHNDHISLWLITAIGWNPVSQNSSQSIPRPGLNQSFLAPRSTSTRLHSFMTTCAPGLGVSAPNLAHHIKPSLPFRIDSADANTFLNHLASLGSTHFPLSNPGSVNLYFISHSFPNSDRHKLDLFASKIAYHTEPYYSRVDFG